MPYRPASPPVDELLAWRERIRFDGEVHVGVMVLPSASMARKLVAAIPEITVPDHWVESLERDRQAGVKLACRLAHAVEDSHAFDGVHLIPGSATARQPFGSNG